MANDLESGNLTGTGVVPTASVPGGGAGDSGGAATNEAVLKRLAELDGLVRSLQSDKDKGVQKALNEVGTLRDQIAQYEKLRSRGIDPDEALDKLELRQLLAERRGGNVPTSVPATAGGGAPAGTAKVDHSILIEQLGLNANDPEVIQALREGGDDITLISRYVAIAQAHKQKPAPTPAAAQQMPVPSSQQPDRRNILDVEAELEVMRHQPGFAGTAKYRNLVKEHAELVKDLTG